MIFENIIGNLAYMGVMEVLLPFLLVFALVWAVLQKTKILGQDARKVNIIISVIMGLSVVFPHVLWGMNSTSPYLSTGMYDPVNIINNALPNISVVLVAILMLLIIVGVFGGQWELGGTSLAGWVVIFAILTVGVVFGSAAGWFRLPQFLWFLQDPQTQAMLLVILVFAIVIWFITKDDSPENRKNAKGLGEFFGEVLKRK